MNNFGQVQADRFGMLHFWQNVFFDAFRLTGKAEDAIKEANSAMAAFKDTMNHIDNSNPDQEELF